MKKEKLRKQIEKCSKCKNVRHIVIDGKRIRCVCYNTAEFLSLFDQSGADETQIDKQYLLTLKSLFNSHHTVVLFEQGPAIRIKYENSALYLATRNLHSAKSFSDKDIIDAVFNNAEKVAVFERFMSFDFICLTVGSVFNENFISQYILEILIKRRQLGRKTLLICPSREAAMQKYKDNEFVSYLDSLKAEGACFTPSILNKKED